MKGSKNFHLDKSSVIKKFDVGGSLKRTRRHEPSEIIADVPQSEIAQRSGRGALVTLLARLLNLFLTLLSQAILGRLLRPAEYGIYAMGMTVLTFLLIFREFGLQAAGVQKEKLTYGEASFLFWGNLLLIGGLGALGIIAAPLAGAFYHSPQVATVLSVMSIAAVLGGVSAQHTMILRRQLRFETIVVIDVLGLACGLVAGLCVGLWRRDVWALLTLYVVQQAVVSALSFLLTGWIPGRPYFERKSHLPMLRFGAGVTLANVLYYLTNNIGAILIGRQLGPVQLGHYNRAQQIYSIPSNVLFSSVYVVAFASLSRLRAEPDEYRAFYRATLQRVAVFYMFLSGILIFAGRDLMRVLLGPGWDVAGKVISILAIALVGSGMAQMSGMLYQSQGRIREFQIWGVVDSIVRISCIIVSSHWGIYGFAIGFAVSTTVVTAPASLWFVGRKGPVSFSDQFRSIVPGLIVFLCTVFGSGVASVLLGFDHAPGIIGLFVKGGGGLISALVIGSIIPVTRRCFLEIARGLYSVLPYGLRRVLMSPLSRSAK